MIKNIVFDMGQVLVKFEPYKYISHYTNDVADTEVLKCEIFDSKEWIGLDHGIINQQQAANSISMRLPENLQEIAVDIVFNWHKYREPVAGMEEVVQNFINQGYNVYVLSNISDAYFHLKEFIPALKLIDNHFLSYQWNMLKPCKEIFTGFCLHFDLIPKECLFIDDSPINAFMAEQCGLNSIIFHNDIKKLNDDIKNYIE